MHPQVLRISIKQSKTDLFHRGVDLLVGRTCTDVCPVVAMLNYLVVRGIAPGLVFIRKDGTFLTRQTFVLAVRQALEVAGIDQSKYCEYSFHIGARTAATAKEVENFVIKVLGRWYSTAYLLYVRIPRKQLAFYSRVDKLLQFVKFNLHNFQNFTYLIFSWRVRY